MVNTLKHYANSLTHFIYPHHCCGCGSDTLTDEQLLCVQCITHLPKTNFTNIYNNIIERKFYGRLNVKYATAAFYFTKQSLVQHLMHQLKYKGNKEVGDLFGKLLGTQLQQSAKYNDVDIIIPLPLNEKREHRRGYNQAAIIAHGIASVLNKPVNSKAVIRSINTETQTHHTRIERWQNMDGVFVVAKNDAITGKHVLLVDDIVTTGATLEACGKQILEAGAASLSIATVAYTA